MPVPTLPRSSRLEDLDQLTLRRCVSCDRVLGLHLLHYYEVHDKKGNPLDLRLTLECPPPRMA